ncbi:alpha/beta hydrolase [Kyrpidia spormannii]|uniref:Alpha/beta hydrolase n=2 Tax=Kyrpidia spormannii TaxID=2055160 RepID=A0A2K8NC46_9BACL|nr:alpha/beta hydrolase [Kyrpidia spormannii]
MTRAKTIAMWAVGLCMLLTGCAPGDNAAVSSESKDKSKATTGAVVTHQHRIPCADPGIELYLKEKVLATGTAATPSPTKAVLFLEPFGVPTAEAFDLPGYSWMDHLARQGFDTWALDFRGFGQSTRPAAMTQPPNQNAPVVRLNDVLKDVDAAVNFIKTSRGVPSVDLIGWSYGGVAAGAYAAQHPENVHRVVLYGAMHGFQLPGMTQPMEEKPGVLKKDIPAYQLATFAMTMQHWNMMMNGRPLVSADAVEGAKKIFMESDPTAGDRNPPSVRRPMGPMVDLYAIWSNRPIFDAGKIQCPTLVVRGDSDFFADPTLFDKLTSAKEKKEVVIPEATHWAIYEKNRGVLLEETLKFLQAQ